jgi:hypothetical protein
MYTRQRGVKDAGNDGTGEWSDVAAPVETNDLVVRWSRKDHTRHVAHVTVPYDRHTNYKLYIKVALTASWLRRVFSDRPFSVRRARDVGNATEIMSDKQTTTAAVSMIEELCRFQAHDILSPRRYSSPNVCELAVTPPDGFDFLTQNDDTVQPETNDTDDHESTFGTMFAVRVGRITGTKVHVYTSDTHGEDADKTTKHQRVVVFGCESDVQNALSAMSAMISRVCDGESHSGARAWVLNFLSDMYRSPAVVGPASTWEDDDEDEGVKPIVIRRCEQEVTSWLEEKERRAALAAATESASMPAFSKKVSEGASISYASVVRASQNGAPLAQQESNNSAPSSDEIASVSADLTGVSDSKSPAKKISSSSNIASLDKTSQHDPASPTLDEQNGRDVHPNSEAEEEAAHTSSANPSTTPLSVRAPAFGGAASPYFANRNGSTSNGAGSGFGFQAPVGQLPQQQQQQPPHQQHIQFAPPPWANAAVFGTVMTCRACGVYPRRVALLPCAHLALCILCNDVTKKNGAPCAVCGTHIKERMIFYLD